MAGRWVGAGAQPHASRPLRGSAAASSGSWRPRVPTPHLPSGLSVHLPAEQVLLSLSDEDLELGLGVCSSLHRRKLRLAIEDYRDAEAGRRWVGTPGHPAGRRLHKERRKVHPGPPAHTAGAGPGVGDGGVCPGMPLARGPRRVPVRLWASPTP